MKKDSEKTAKKGNKTKDIKQTTNAVFERYRKSFKDLAVYDREGKLPAN